MRTHILPIIIFSQFAGTSLWFAGNAILVPLQQEYNLGNLQAGDITSMVQFGFIAGTLVFAIFSFADRFHPSKVFFVSCLVASASNLLILSFPENIKAIYLLRFITGFFLAGIYPVGMKLAADWYQKGLGKALGYLVGALVLGTAFPFLLRSDAYALPWKQVLIFTSLFDVAGGILVLLFIKRGPYHRSGTAFQASAIFRIFRSSDFRAAAIGYFGHMWELYAFWAFVPVILELFKKLNQHPVQVDLWSFLVIGTGTLGCVAGGYIAQRIGSPKVAFYSLLVSGLCCMLSPFSFYFSLPVFLLFLLVWGFTVVSDSPQFSAIVAEKAIPEFKGTALTIVTCIGFSITIVSIQLLKYLFQIWEVQNGVWTVLAVGPFIGLAILRRIVRAHPEN